MKPISKLLLVNLGIGLADVLLFSKAGLNWSITSADTLVQAASITAMIMSAGLFLYANHAILYPKPKALALAKKLTTADYIEELKKLQDALPFAAEEIRVAIGQHEEFRRKQDALVRVAELNNNACMGFLMTTSGETEAYLGEKFRQIAIQLIILDVGDEKRYLKKHYEQIRQILQKSEEVLDQFDAFLEEVSRMGARVDMENVGLLSSIDALRALRGADGSLDTGDFASLQSGQTANTHAVDAPQENQ